MSITNNFKKASRRRRYFALYIDWIIACMIAVPFLSFLPLEQDPNEYYIIGIFLTSILFIFKDCLLGMSFGKCLLGIAVRDSIDYNKTPVVYRLILRNVSLLFLPLLWPIEFIAILLGNEKRRIGDRIAKTDVIYLGTLENKCISIIMTAITLIYGTVLLIFSIFAYDYAFALKGTYGFGIFLWLSYSILFASSIISIFCVLFNYSLLRSKHNISIKILALLSFVVNGLLVIFGVLWIGLIVLSSVFVNYSRSYR